MEYIRQRSSPQAWMLARFVLPAPRLEEMRSHMDKFDARSPLRLSLLISGASDPAASAETLQFELSSANQFRQDHPARVSIEQIETRLPTDLLDTNVITVRRFLDEVADDLTTTQIGTDTAFLELPLNPFLHQTLPILTGACAAANRESSGERSPRFGIKIRTGGTDASAFPNPSSVAYVIGTCHNAGVPFKATAGLHHPVRHRNDAMGTMMHGFLNVFCAAALTYAHDLDEAVIGEILADDQARSFEFDARELRWRGYSASLTQIRAARSELALSFGSCSVQEPVDDLKALGLLDA